jgi:hypothetical protein
MSRFSDLYSPKKKEETKQVSVKPTTKEVAQKKKTTDTKDKN